ncbi:MAG: UDP-N-acetylmuramoyl-L-alanyl-D-glutamate--2,6-diaminopimelate ligase [Coriobacteriales bacterium]|nr:UDP-N-acetylmuramoyl-L-alanyl-D-glutamate--2,6-diaminopimelate ligase [Coriobacteriales bacterium]
MASRQLYDLLNDLEYRLAGSLVDEGLLFSLSIESLAYRSDQVAPNSLFFAIRGTKFDGHDFVAEAASRGASALIVERPLDVDLLQIVVADSRQALALVSRRFFDDPSARLKVSAITGTNGKTTTTCLLDWIARYAFNHAAAPEEGQQEPVERTGLIGTVETRIGATRLRSTHTTPESYELQRLLARCVQEGITHVAMEVSSHAIQLKRVAGVHFALAAFSNLTQDHLDFHGSMEAYFEAKAALFDSPLVARRIVNIDDEWGRRLLERCRVAGWGETLLTCGLSEGADIRACDVVYSAQETTLLLETPEGSFPLRYPLVGAFNVSNILLAASCASALGIDWPTIIAALATAPQIPGRLERVAPSAARIGVFVDYAHTPDSIVKALDAINGLRGQARSIIVFGCGGDRDATKRPLMGTAALEADYCVVTSDNPRSEDPAAIIADILPGMTAGAGRFEVEVDRRRAIARALALAEPGDLVLIAGKGHEDYQIVGDTILAFDDRVVAAEELARLRDKAARP